MASVEILFVDEVDPLDPWGSPEPKLNEEMIGSLIGGPAEGVADEAAAVALLYLADNELRAYGTDSTNQLRDPQIRLVLASVARNGGSRWSDD